jgi:two-component system sensor histidine kinase TtrS
MTRKLVLFNLLVLTLLALCPGVRSEEVVLSSSSQIGIGVLAYRGEEDALAIWEPTIEYLNTTLSDFSFTLVPLHLNEMEEAVRRNTVDFILTNTGNYVDLEARYGVSRIATLESLYSPDPKASIGSAIITRSDRNDIRDLADLQGKSLMAVDEDAFGGFQIAWRELLEYGVDPHTDLTELIFTGFPQDKIVYAVRDGEVDAGIVRTCLLERMAREGQIDLATIRILSPQQNTGLDCLTSTRLYPEWPFAKLKETPRQLAKDVAKALLSLSSDSEAARAGEYAGWTIPVDYQPVHDLFRELQIGPYAWMRETTLKELFQRYRYWFFILALVVIWTIWHMARVEYLVKVRTIELLEANKRLEHEIAERKRVEESDRLHQAELAHVSRVSTMGELASGLAHELNQPLAAITNYARGCARRLETGSVEQHELLEATLRIVDQAERAAAIIQRLRGFLRKKESAHTVIDINATVGETVELFSSEARKNGVTVRMNLAPRLPPTHADMIEIEQVILNLMRNGVEAMADVEPEHRELVISTGMSNEDSISVDVRDNGHGLSDEERMHLFEPFYTTKTHGTGLGLSISRSIIEAHGGNLQVTPNADRGLTVRFTLPVFRELTRDAT